MSNKDYFIIPCEGDSLAYVYFPIKGAFFKISSSLIEKVEEYCENGNIDEEYKQLKEHIDKIRSMRDLKASENNSAFPHSVCFLLSEKCNLACTYCYAHDSHSQAELKKEDIRACIDYLFSYRKKHRVISFLGGGEPMMTWSLIKDAVEYSTEVAKSNNEYVHFGITTNMTIFNSEMIDFIKKYDIKINASFDVLPDIQDSQRIYSNGMGTFSVVDKNLKLLLENGIAPRIRATITSLNVKRMPEMVRFVKENYPKIRGIHFEHVSNAEEMGEDDYFSEFIKNYFVALEIANKSNIRLTNSIINSVKNIKKHFCSKEFCITAFADIVSCHRVSNDTKISENPFSYGKLDNGNVILFDSKEDSCLLSPKCDNCFAKFNCAGGCRYNRYILNENSFDKYCGFIRQMLVAFFDYLLDKSNEKNKQQV